MKILVHPYSFSASSHIVGFTSYASALLENVLLITNTKTNDVIYNFANSTLGGSMASGNLLTLAYDTSSMGNTDPLQIFYEDGNQSYSINDGGNSLTVDGTIATTQSGTWVTNSLATVLNFPNTQSVTQGTSPWVTAGTATVTQSGVVHVDDNSSSLTVDGSVSATQSGNWSVGLTGLVSLASGTEIHSLATVLNFPSNQNVTLTSSPTLFAVVNTSSINLNSGATVNVMNFPTTQAITGTATVTQSGTVHVDDNSGSLTVDNGGTFAVQSSQSGNWTVGLSGLVSLASGTEIHSLATVLNFPSNQNVTITSSPTLYAVVNTGNLTINSGATVNVMNFPATQTVTGTATVTQSGVVHVDDNSSSLTVDGSVSATQSGTWDVGLNAGTSFIGFATVSVSNPTLYAVVNTAAAGVTNSLATILNFPTTQAITGTATVTQSGVVHIDDNSGSLTVDGTVAATQSGNWSNSISGLVSLASGTEIKSLATILNFPATQAVTQSGTWNVGLNAGTNFIGFATVAVSTPTLYAVVNTGTVNLNSGATVNVMNFPATQAVSQSGTWNVGLNSGTNFVGFATVSVSNPTLYAVVNTGTVNLNSGATVNVMNQNTQYAEDASHVSGDLGNMALAVRDDTTPATLSSTDGDYEPLHLDGNGNLWVTLGSQLSKAQDSIAIWSNTVKDGSGTPYMATVDSNGYIQNVLQTGTNFIGFATVAVSTPTLYAVVNTGTVNLNSGATVNVMNFPATQVITGTATVTQSGVVHVDDNSSSLTVDNSGTFAVQAAQSGTWTTNSLATVLNFPAIQTITGTATVTQSGVVHIDDNSGSLTVDGTIAATQSGTWNTGLTGLVSLASGTELRSLATILNFPTTQAVTQSGTWNVGLNSGTNFVGFATVSVSNPTLYAVVNTGALTLDSGATVDVMNFPATYPVTDNAGSLTVDNAGTFAVQATQSGSWGVYASLASTTLVQVGDNGGSLTVDGSVTANAGTNLNTSALALESGGNLDILAGAISNTLMKTALASSATLYAVVNTSAAGITNSLATILNFPSTFGVTQSTSPWVTSGLATVTQSGVVHVDDNASSLTVDGTVAATQSGSWAVNSLATILNFPSSQNVVLTSAPTLFAVVNTGAVGITNSLATILNFPATTAVTQSTSPWVVSGTATITPSGVLHVDDNSSSLTVDNSGTFAVQAAQSGSWGIYASLASGTIVQVGDNGSSLTVDNAGTFAVQSTLQAGTNFIGFATVAVSTPTLYAVVNTSAAGVTNSLATVLNFPAVQAVTSMATILNFPSTFGVTQSTSPWVTAGLATVTPSGVVHVDDNSSSLTVDNGGTFAVQSAQSGSWGVYASLASGTIVQVGDNNGSLTVDNGGTFAVQATQSGSWGVFASLASSAFITTNLTSIGGSPVATGVGAVSSGTQRVVQTNDAGKTLNSTGGVVTASGDNGILASVGSKRKVFAYSLSTPVNGGLTAIFKSGGGGTEVWRVFLSAPTGVSTGANLAITPPSYLFAATSGASLTLNLSSAATVHWALSYFDEA